MIGSMLAMAALLAGASGASVQAATLGSRAEVAIGTAAGGGACVALEACGAAEEQQQGAADSLYQAARALLSRGRYGDAVQAFRRLRERFPRSANVADSYYWEVFALSRLPANLDTLRRARALLRTQAERYPDAATRSDAEVLAVRIEGQLARMGDAEAGEALRRGADVDVERPSREPRLEPTIGVFDRYPRTGAPADTCTSTEEEGNVRIAALNALTHVNAAEALPILRRVLERRDACSEGLRRRAVFIVSQTRSEEVVDVLLGAARSDPDAQVRAQAVYWLHQEGTDRSVAVLDSILNGSDDRDLQQQALVALVQHRIARARDVVRQYIERSDRPVGLRVTAIGRLGGRYARDNGEYFRALYQRLGERELRSRVIQILAEAGDSSNVQFLMGVARDSNESVENRSVAVNSLGRRRASGSGEFLRGLYPTVRDQALKSRILQALVQTRDSASLRFVRSVALDANREEGESQAAWWHLARSGIMSLADLVALYRQPGTQEFRQRVLLSISQLRDEGKVDALIDIARTETNAQLRSRAISLLGQSRDPRAVRFLLEVLGQ